MGEAAHRIHELVPGVRWYLEQKGDRGLISIFSCELGVLVVLLVFLRDSPQSVLSGQCVAKPCLSRNSFGCPNLIQVRVFPAQKQEAKQELTDAPFPPAVFFLRLSVSLTMGFSRWKLLACPAISLHLFFSPSAALGIARLCLCGRQGEW